MRKFYKFSTDQNFISFLLQENVEWQKIESEFSVEAKSGTRSLSLHGLTFTTVACHSLFVWGNALLYRYSYYPLPSTLRLCGNNLQRLLGDFYQTAYGAVYK